MDETTLFFFAQTRGFSKLFTFFFLLSMSLLIVVVSYSSHGHSSELSKNAKESRSKVALFSSQSFEAQSSNLKGVTFSKRLL